MVHNRHTGTRQELLDIVRRLEILRLEEQQLFAQLRTTIEESIERSNRPNNNNDIGVAHIVPRETVRPIRRRTDINVGDRVRITSRVVLPISEVRKGRVRVTEADRKGTVRGFRGRTQHRIVIETDSGYRTERELHNLVQLVYEVPE